MKIISCNVNGIRSAYRKGFLEFIQKENPDIFCLQEIKANKEDLPSELINVKGYFPYFNSAQKKGYAGVAVYTKWEPISINASLGCERFDVEGRILELDYSDFTLINLYIPHGGRQKENLDYKLEVYRGIFKKIDKLKNKNIILVGDFNIAHKEIDLARPKENKNNIMFTPEERKQIDKFLNLNLSDSFRQLNNNSGNYTWWPYAFNAKERNMGWRIDYIFVSKELTERIKGVDIYSKTNFSDHCPIGLELKIE
jgi:exodeoxyribonuclease-3